MTRITGTAKPVQIPIDPVAEAALLEQWSEGARRSAAAHLRRLGVSPDSDLASDIAQEALLRLLLAFRKGQTPSDRYIRRIIANAVRRAARQLLTHEKVECAEPFLDDLPTSESDHPDILAETAVRRWTVDLPPVLRRTYFNVYVLGKTQRSTAIVMGVTQPRVSQLHAQLLKDGRSRLEVLAA